MHSAFLTCLLALVLLLAGELLASRVLLLMLYPHLRTADALVTFPLTGDSTTLFYSGGPERRYQTTDLNVLVWEGVKRDGFDS